MSNFQELAGRLAGSLEEKSMWGCKRKDGTYGNCWCYPHDCWKDGEPTRITCRRAEAALKDYYEARKEVETSNGV